MANKKFHHGNFELAVYLKSGAKVHTEVCVLTNVSFDNYGYSSEQLYTGCIKQF